MQTIAIELFFMPHVCGYVGNTWPGTTCPSACAAEADRSDTVAASFMLARNGAASGEVD